MPFEFHTYKDKKGKQLLYYIVYYDNDQFSINTKVRCKKSDYKNRKVKGDILATIKLANIEEVVLTSLKKATDKLPFWTIDQLRKHIELNLQSHESEGREIKLKLYDWWLNRIERYDKLEMYDTAMHHENSMKAIFEHLNEDQFIESISKAQLIRLKDLLIYGKEGKKRSSSTLNGYFRDLRAVINDAIDEQELNMTNPFKGFEMPKMKSKTNATLTWNEFVRFRDVKPKTEFQQIVKDMFLFAYYCGGVRVRDLFQLTWSDIKENRLIYSTNKTDNPFNFELLPESKEILSRYSKKTKYIFPVLEAGLTGKEHVKEIKNKGSAVNRSLKRLAKYCKIDPEKFSIHISRHTYASVNDHLSDYEMQLVLGHKETRTTTGYRKRLSTQDNLINQTRR